MNKRKTIALLIFSLLATAGVAHAHYPLLIGDRSPNMGQRDGVITFTYGLGELHERVFAKAKTPDWVHGYTFDGITLDLTDKLKQKGQLTTLKYHSRRVGDTWIVVHTPMAWSEHDTTFTETTVRTIVHQGLSRGWETPLGLPLEMVPLNQPYGLLPGDTFRVELLHKGKPLSNVKIYAEKYYDPPMKKPFIDEVLRTRIARTDSSGIAMITFHSPGWWALFATHELDGMKKDGKTGIANLQDVVWVYIDEHPSNLQSPP